MKFRKLRADEIECRIAQCFDGNKATALLYKTARVDRAMLDEAVGDLWQNDFKLIDGKMYGGIGIYNKDLNQWLWRWDCGTESNTEKEKGEASDCFKRAGFKWGIGIELYSAPKIWLNIATKKRADGKFEAADKYDKYTVSQIDYDTNGNIIKLTITDKNNNILFSYGAGKKTEKVIPIKLEQPTEEELCKELNTITRLSDLNKFCNKYKKLAEEKGYKKMIEQAKERYSILTADSEVKNG